MMKNPFIRFLFHRATLVVAGIAAVAIVGVSVLTKAAIEPTKIMDITTDCNDLGHFVVTLDAPVFEVVSPGMEVMDSSSNYISVEAKVINEKIDVYLWKAMTLAPGGKYTFVIKAGGIINPKNTTEIRYEFTQTCPAICTAPAVPLSLSNLTYQSPIGNINYKPDTLSSDNPAIKFSLDKINRVSMIDATVLSVPKTIYVKDEKTMATHILYNVLFDKNIRTVTFDVAVPCKPVCSETIPLDSTNQTYKLSIGSMTYDLNFDLKAMLLGKGLAFSYDKVNVHFDVISLEEAVKMGFKEMYVSNDGGKTWITLSNLVITLGVSVKFDVIKDCPACSPRVNIAKGSEYTSTLGKVLFDGNGITYSQSSQQLLFSIDLIKWGAGVGLRGVDKVYVSADGGKTYITFANIQLIEGVSVSFDDLTIVCDTDTDGDGIFDGEDNCPVVVNPGQENTDGSVASEETVSLTKASPTYTFLHGVELTWDGCAVIRTVNGSFSFDEGKTRMTEYKGYDYPKSTIWVKDEKTQTVITLAKITQECSIAFSFTLPSASTDDGVGDACDCEGGDQSCTAELYCEAQGTPDSDCDTDGDGVANKDDEFPLIKGSAKFRGAPAFLRVSVEENVNGMHTDTALETKVFDANPGSCAATIGAQPKNYAQIRKECTAENIKTTKETVSAVVDGKKPQNLISELVGIGATPGNKLVLVQSQASIDGSFGYMGFDLPNMLDGQSRDVGFNIVAGQELNFVQTAVFTKNSKGFRQSLLRAQVIKGSLLEVFQPDYVLWNGVEQVYPFMFVSEGARDVDVCLDVPQGYKIAEPGKCGQTFVSDETKIIEFVAVDVGSPKDFKMGAKMKFKHKGKTTNFNANINSHNPNANGK